MLKNMSFSYGINVTQGFLYAPFGEIIDEYVPLWLPYIR